MALATVTGSLKDLSLASMGNRAPELVFEIDDLVTAGSGTLIPQEPITVIPASDGSFSVDLHPSAETNPFAPYKLTVNWQSKGVNRSVTPSWRIFVPAGGGAIASMLSVVYPDKVVTKGDKGNDGNVLQQAAIDALTAKNVAQDAALADLPNQYVPLSRGVLPNNTDLNTLTGPQHVGAWSLLQANTYPNAPALPGTAVLEVQRGSGNSLSVVHRITVGNVMQWREATDTSTGSWSAWEQAETKSAAGTKNAEQDGRLSAVEAKNTAQDGRLDGIDARDTAQDVRMNGIDAKNLQQDARLDDLPNQYVPLSRGTLPSGVDLNTLTGPEHVGDWALLTTNTYPNAPAFTSTAVLEVRRGSGTALSVVHRVTFGINAMWREAVDAATGAWSDWVHTETTERADAKNAAQDDRLSALEVVAPKVSNLALDTDGVPYYSHGSTEVHVIQDPDGVPYFITFLQASVGTDGTLYL